jgi:hypothetical protein
MDQAGRTLLYRVCLRCAVEYGAALGRANTPGAPPELCAQPFESVAWHEALYICDSLRRGIPFAQKFLAKG